MTTTIAKKFWSSQIFTIKYYKIDFASGMLDEQNSDILTSIRTCAGHALTLCIPVLPKTYL